MASSNKTSLGFNNWIGTDIPQMDDFNNDNLVSQTEIDKLNSKIVDLNEEINSKFGAGAIFTPSNRIENLNAAPVNTVGIWGNCTPTSIGSPGAYGVVIIFHNNSVSGAGTQIVFTYNTKNYFIRTGNFSTGVYEEWKKNDI